MKENGKNLTEFIVEGKEPYISTTSIEGLLHIQRPIFKDERGCFQENFRIPDIEKLWGEEVKILQDQTSISENSGVLRGIHAEPNQAKIIKPKFGHAVCIWVDLREKSTTFKRKVIFEFDYNDYKKHRSVIAVPKGVGNSFYVIKGPMEYDYSVTQIYDNTFSNAGVYWNDPDLALPWGNWGIVNPILSDRDSAGLGSLSDYLKKYGPSLNK